MSENQTPSGFRALSVADRLCEKLGRANITVPTPIQEQAIPVAMEGRDLIGIAQTGTGKTLAFGLPIAARIKAGDNALILAPTRELAQQIAETIHKLELSTVLVVGGAPMNRQMSLLRTKPQVIIATPGRLIDHLNRGSVRLNKSTIVVLDEADRMLDMGFEPAIRRILDATPSVRQTMLFSATMPEEIAGLTGHYLNDPVRIECAPAGTASELVEQELVYVSHDDKHPMLGDLLHEQTGTVLVFARTRHGARKLAKFVRDEGHTAAEIHADRTLAQRREALQGFKGGLYRVLVATDIAARGIDVKDISMVVNFDVPENPEDYVHRIGRTGRAGAKGRAVTIAIPAQTRDIRDIERLLGTDFEISAKSTAQPQVLRGGGGNGRPRSRGGRPQGPNHGRPRRVPTDADTAFVLGETVEPSPRRDHDRSSEKPKFDRPRRDDRRPAGEGERSFSAPRTDRPNVPTDRPFSKPRYDGPRDSDRPAGDRNDSRPRYESQGRSEEGARSSYGKRFGSSDRPSYGKPRFEGRGNSYDRPAPTEDANGRPTYASRPTGDRPAYQGDRPYRRPEGGGGGRPAYGKPRYEGGNDRPSTGGDRPYRRPEGAGGGDRPSYGKPRYEGSRPAGGSDRPYRRPEGAGGGDRPSYGKPRYEGGNDRPSTGGDRPYRRPEGAGGGDRPSYGKPRYEGGAGRPAGGSDRPSYPASRSYSKPKSAGAPTASGPGAKKGHRGWSGKPPKKR